MNLVKQFLMYLKTRNRKDPELLFEPKLSTHINPRNEG